MELNPPPPRKNGKSPKDGHSAHPRRKAVSISESLKRAAAAADESSRPMASKRRTLLEALRTAGRGDFAVRLPEDTGNPLADKVAQAFNLLMEMNEDMTNEVVRIGRVVGREGRMTERAFVPNARGGSARKIEAINALIGDLVQPTTEVARVISAVAAGDFTQKMDLEIEGSPVKGEFLRIGKTVNAMVDQLSSFAAEVTRVAKEVGTEGKLGGQAEVQGLSGVWKDLTDNVNFMASNLTNQMRNIALVTTAVANGDLSKKITVDVKGEILELKNTINMMVDQLNSFASEVTRVAREVGTDGSLGGQAQVKGVAGVWGDLTNNVNQLAANLTAQVRAISSVATSVTEGDLTRYIDVEARGEVAQLKDNINQMITNLKDTTRKNTEQDWLKTNLARFSSMLQGLKDLQTVSRLIMSELTPLVSAHLGAFYLFDSEADVASLKLTNSYAYRERKSLSNRFRLGEGLVGQCALEKKPILLTEVPDDYLKINSGLGERAPINIIVLPVLFEGEVKAVIELASFHPFSPIHQLFLDQLTENLGVVLNMIGANMRTEELLQQSQSLTQELQNQSKELTERQEELKRTNSALEKQALELEEKAKLLEEQNRKVAVKNQEIESARIALEEKAKQLALISKYKSEFLANMSHELRTPLNSLLILAKLLSENSAGNLNDKQVEYARTIYSSGGDLLALINEILDLTKVEAGKVRVEPREVPLSELTEAVERRFRPLATQKGLLFTVETLPGAPAWIHTDPLRLQQVLNNLLGNAFKFTDSGSVSLRIAEALAAMPSPSSGGQERVVAFEVSDTGIGIPSEKHEIIFEAFQQADGTTSRKYGGTGLGLSISREIARLLGGDIQVTSTPGKGSTFTLFLRDRHPGSDSSRVDEAPPRGRSSVEAPAIVSRPTALAVEDDRAEITSADRLLLVIEDDSKFARIMTEMARERRFKVVVAKQGDTGLALANELVPDAITLDIQLPVMDGWEVLERLKRNPRTRHIPVHVISVVEQNRKAASLGAFAYLEKPVSKEKLDAAFAHISQFLDRTMRMLLVVEDDAEEQRSLVEWLSEGSDLEVTAVSTAEEALIKLEREQFDCMIVDLILPGLDGGRLIEQVKTHPRHRDLPIVVFTGKELASAEEKKLRTYAESVIIKLDPNALDRLRYDTAIFLHRVQERLPHAVEKLSREQVGLAGKKVLIVDDDVPNIFALTSVLEAQKMRVIYAEDGKAGGELLAANPDIDIVLMDIMMPELDGYQALQAIRKNPRHKALPIIAVTARALKEDREKCVAAGATDYLAKPVDPDRLVEMVRLWTGNQPRPMEMS